jgi:amino acid transporter
MTWGKILPLALFVIVGLFFIKGDRVWPVPLPAHEHFREAALLVLFAYAGFENIAAPAGEFKNPRRDIPFALFVMITSVTAIYALVQLVAIGTIANLGASKTPLADGMTEHLGAIGGLIMTVGAALSVLGTMNNTILAGPRYLYALSERGVLPAVFKKVHPTWHTPYVAILTQSSLAALLVLGGKAEALAELSMIARLATYVGTAAAVPILRKKMPKREGSLRLPGGPVIPIVALAICIVFLSSATTRNLIAGVIALAIGAVIFMSRKGQLPAETPEEA